jgi:hypothetical protein
MTPHSKILEDLGPQPEYPQKTFGFRAYKDGVCREFPDRKSAEQFSKLVEKFQTNVEYYDSWMAEYSNYHNQVSDRWHSEARAEFDELSDAQYNVLYNKAYEDGHSSGYDEIFSYMEDYATFYSDMVQASSPSQFEVRQH